MGGAFTFQEAEYRGCAGLSAGRMDISRHQIIDPSVSMGEGVRAGACSADPSRHRVVLPPEVFGSVWCARGAYPKAASSCTADGAVERGCNTLEDRGREGERKGEERWGEMMER